MKKRRKDEISTRRGTKTAFRCVNMEMKRRKKKILTMQT